MKYCFFYVVLLSGLLVACSSGDDPVPEAEKGPVAFVDVTTALDVYPTESYSAGLGDYSVLVDNFDEEKHTLVLNGKTLKIQVAPAQNGVDTQSKVYFSVPNKIGSGRLELHNGDAVIQGPQVNYLQRYLYVPLYNRLTGSTICGYQDGKIILFNPLQPGFYVMRFAGFSTSSSSDYAYTFTYKSYPVTYPSIAGTGVTRRYQFTGMTATTNGGVNFYRLFDDKGVRSYHILNTTDLTTAVDFSGGVATGSIGTVLDMEQDTDGNLYTVEGSRRFIRKIYPDGVVMFAGSGNTGDADGANIEASFRAIRGITIDTHNNIYAADSGRVRMITPAGAVNTLAGATQTGDKDGSMADARFGMLFGIAAAPDGTLYVHDAGNSKFKVISADRKTVRTLTVLTGSSSGITLGPKEYDESTPMYVDAAGNIFYLQNEMTLYMLMPEDNAPPSIVSKYLSGGSANMYFSNMVAE